MGSRHGVKTPARPPLCRNAGATGGKSRRGPFSFKALVAQRGAFRAFSPPLRPNVVLGFPWGQPGCQASEEGLGCGLCSPASPQREGPRRPPTPSSVGTLDREDAGCSLRAWRAR